jgi:SNF2 family DNA or RNA helicase
MPHQLRALEFAEPRDIIGLFMEMRLGKSLVITRWAQSKSPKRTLILAPSSTIPDWLDELKKENQTITYLDGPRKNRVIKARKSDGWFITNYEGIVIPIDDDDNWVAPILTLRWDVMILDESTRVKNPTAKITQAILKKTYNTRHKAIMSGYPSPESPMDFYCQMAFLLNGKFMNCNNWWSFRHYNFLNVWGYEWAPKKGTINNIKSEIRKYCFILTRKEANIGSKKIKERRFVKQNSKQKKMVRQIENDFIVKLASGVTLESKYVIENCTWLSRIAGGFDPEGTSINTSKAREVLELLRGELKNEQIVIWFKFNAELDWMYDFLHGVYKYSCACVFGATKINQRREIQKDFSKGKYQILLVQIKTGKMGIDYSAADTAIYYSHTYSGEERYQSEDRIVHPKKETPLLLIDLITKDSIDEDIVELTHDKNITAKRLLRRVTRRRFMK